MTTYTLRSGEIVTAQSPDWPTQYANRTQAARAAAKIPGATVLHRGRPFYVQLPPVIVTPTPTLPPRDLCPTCGSDEISGCSCALAR